MSTIDPHEYAWNWFEYHARQRLTEFRFFLIFFAALVVAFRTGTAPVNLLFVQVICGAGMFISLAFLMLDRRNEQLVNVARDALEHLEETTYTLKHQQKFQLVHISQQHSCWTSHSCWFRLMYVGAIVLFALGAIFPSVILA